MDIEIENLTVCYGKHEVLKDLNFLFEKNHIYAILGPNGCGKTTLVDRIAKDFSKTSDISYIAQETLGELELKAYDVVSLGRYNPKDFYHSLTREDKDKIEKAMSDMDISHVQDRNFDTLSGGEKQRIQIARALAKDYEWLLCDEPTSSLDVKHQVLFARTVKRIHEEGKSVIVVLHDINLASSIADRILLMKDGRIYKAGIPSEVLTEENLRACFDTDFVRIQNEDRNIINFIYNV